MKQVRLLPSDFQKRVKIARELGYDRVDDVPKDIKVVTKKPRGFFPPVPEELLALAPMPEMKPFLVFYFETEEDCESVKAMFELPKKGGSHPFLNSKKLVEISGGMKNVRESK